MNTLPLKVIYTAGVTDGDPDVTSGLAAAAGRLSAKENASALIVADRLVRAGQDEYETDDQATTVDNLMSLVRRVDEVWLVGPVDEFRMELRVARYCSMRTRRFSLAGSVLVEDTGFRLEDTKEC